MIEIASATLVVVGSLALLRTVLQMSGIAPKVAATRRLRVVETCALGPRRRLHIVEACGERILVGASESGLTLLRSLPSEPSSETEPETGSDAEPTPDGDTQHRTPGRRWLRALGVLALPLLVLLDPSGAAAEGVTIELNGATEPDRLDSTLQLMAVLTLVSVAPSILLMATCFTRIVIVLAFLRQAIGVQGLPPNQVIVGLALFTTFFVMAPLGQQIHDEAYQPYVAEEIGASEAYTRAITPVRRYLLTHTREGDLGLFFDITGREPVDDLDELPMTTILPAFMLSELRTAFEIGFMIYLPFLVIDLVVASMLISMGMIVLPPIVISLPFKLMLFVLLDGWNLVLGSLINGLR